MRARPLLGTLVRISVEADLSVDDAQCARMDHLISKAFEHGRVLEHIFSRFKADSTLKRYDRDPRTPVEPEFERALALARHVEDVSAGAFRTRDENGALDLTGLAKGFIADQLAERLCAEANGLRGVVNAGGDQRHFGPPPFTSWIRLDVNSAQPLTSDLAAIATSSVLESECNPDSSTVYSQPLREGVTTAHVVSVLAPTCAVADALTKVGLFGSRAALTACAAEFGARILIFSPHGELEDVFA